MDFQKFRSSHFFKVGQSRFFVFGRQVQPEHFCMYDTMTVTAPDSNDPIIPDHTLPPSRRITPFHLKHALGFTKTNPNDNDVDFIPEEFKNVITQQWIEVADICNKILNDYNKDLTDPKDKLRWNVGKLLVTEPGMPIMQHGHDVKQTVTMVYFFDEDKLDNVDEPHLLMGKYYQHKIFLPDSNKIIFEMKDDPLHHVHSNKWGFWWFNDFSKYCELPEGLPHTYWRNPYLDNKNI